MLCICYVCEDSIYETYKYFLILTVANGNANEFQCLSNKTDKQKLHIKIEFQNLIERLSFLCRITDIKIAWINS